MDFFITLLKAIGVVFGLGGGGMLLSSMVMILWVKQSSKGKIYAFFHEQTREFTGELISTGVNDNPERFQSIGGGEYKIDTSKTGWYHWPPGFPRFVQEPIPCLTYVRNNPDPLDAYGVSQASVTAMSLQYMMDEAFLRTTWRDAKDAVDDEKVTNKSNLTYWLLGGIIILLVVCLYFGWQAFNLLSQIKPALGV